MDATAAKPGIWSLSYGLFNLSHSVFCLFLKSAKIWKKKEISLFSPRQLETDVWSSSPRSLLTYTVHCCLSPLPYVCFTFPASFFRIKRMTVLPLPLGSSVSFNYFLTVFIASSLIVLSCSCHLWPHSPLILSVRCIYSGFNSVNLTLCTVFCLWKL